MNGKYSAKVDTDKIKEKRKHKMKKRLLSVLLMLAMVVCLMPAALAADETETGTAIETLAETTNVAFIDTMAKLVEAVKTANSTITVGAVLTVAEGETYDLNLNGCTVNMGAYYIENKGTLTISNGTLVSNSSANETNGAPLYNNGGTLTVASGTYTGMIAALRVNGGTATIEDGTFNVTSTNGSSNCVIRMKGGELTINDGTFNGNNSENPGEGCGIMSADGGTTEINGGTFNNFAGQPGSIFGRGTGVTVKGGTFNFTGTEGYSYQYCLANYLADGYEVDDNGVVARATKVYEVSNKDELDTALGAAKDGDTIKLTADIDYTGAYALVIDKQITLDLGDNTLTTNSTNQGGIHLKGNCTLKNGTLVHKGAVAAIKAWNVTALEDLVIEAIKTDAKYPIGGIVVQNVATNRIDTIKNVTIKGAGLTNGIETYNCGDATQNVIGSMENVKIDAKGTGMLISAPCGTATNCDIKGGVSGIEIWIKGTYSATLTLDNCTVTGGKQAVYAHDEFTSNPDAVNDGTLELTVSGGTNITTDDITLTIARAKKVEGVLEEVMENAVAKIGYTYYSTLDKAFTAANSGDEVTILKADTYALPGSVSGKNLTITGAVDGVVFDNIGAKNMGSANVTFNNVTFDYYPNVNYTGLQHSGNLEYNNCTFNGQVFLYGTSETFNECTFNQNSADAYNVWTYGADVVAFNKCTFNCAGKSVLVYNEGDGATDLTVTDTDFIASAPVDGKAAIEIDTSLMPEGTDIVIDAETTATGFATGSVSGNSLWNNKKGDNTVVVVDGTQVWPYPTITITVNPADAAVVIKQGDAVIGTASGDYTLPNGTYTYSVSKSGYYTSNGSFTVSGENQTITVNLTEIVYIPTFRVSVEQADNGSVKAGSMIAVQGQIVTLTVTPDEGYVLGTLTVTDARGKEVTVTESNGKYTFRMPGSAATVSASFLEDYTLVDLPYTDVTDDAENYAAIAYMYEKGLMIGTSTDEYIFNGDMTMTRAQIAMILYRLAGEPETTYTGVFTDAPKGAWYTEAVEWAASEGIINGVGNDAFAPSREITVVELSALVYRYAQCQLNGVCEAADWATESAAAMTWCVENGVLAADASAAALADRNLAAEMFYSVYILLNK